ENGFRNRENRQYNRDGGYGRENGFRNRENRQYNRDGGYNRENGFRNREFNKDRQENYNSHAKYSQKKQIEYKKQYVDYSKPMRLNKFLANSGICSRREADNYISAGVVTVNGTVISELGYKIIPATDKVMFHDQPVKAERKVYILLNKPKDCVTTVEDTHDRKTVLDIVKNACSERVYPVGRLDRNTTGVLLITNDGDLTTKLTHPKYDKKKIYQVTLDRELEEKDFEKIQEGIVLEDGEIHVDEIAFVNEDDRKTLGVEIHSGRNRIVRRIFDFLGYRVMRLDRVYFAGLTKKNLPRGKWRFLSEMEVNMLKMSAAAMKD
ncbi:MAG: pseudouridine synthase, partial [Candidatus Aphodosoma sp.]